MERALRLLRLARLRQDKAAIAILEGRIAGMWRKVSESELRLLDGNR